MAGVQAQAAQCSVNASGVAFGSYDTLSSTPTRSTGTVTVSCDVSTAFTVALSAGGAGTFDRAMSSGPNRLAYNLFTDAARTMVWGDGAGDTSRMAHSGTSSLDTVYGLVPPQQNIRAGSYGDSLVVTVEF